MLPFFPDRLPWYVAGPVIGLMIVGLYALDNRKLGVTTSYFQLGLALRGRPLTEVWRIWFAIGLLGGAALVAVSRGTWGPTLAYGALGAFVPVALLVPLLFAGGVLIGYGARWGGGCTSGHGVSGTSSLSPASWVATATFVAAAILCSHAIFFLTGGAL